MNFSTEQMKYLRQYVVIIIKNEINNISSIIGKNYLTLDLLDLQH